jgi:hypothetical protein
MLSSVQMRDDPYERFASDSRTLAKIGESLRGQPPDEVAVVPRDLADAAVAAWDRDEEDQLPDVETDRQATLRDHAATLALIGLAIQKRGVGSSDEVHVQLRQEQVVAAIVAADQARTG